LLRRQSAAWQHYWHASLRATETPLVFPQRCRQHRLNQTECEILAALVIAELGLFEEPVSTCALLLKFLALPGAKRLAAMRMLLPQGRLVKSRLITLQNTDDEIGQWVPVLDPGFAEDLVAGRTHNGAAWELSDEAELYERLEGLTRVLRQKSDAIRNECVGMHFPRTAVRWARKVERLLAVFEATVKGHPTWKLAALAKQTPSVDEQIILLALLGKRLGHLPPDADLFTGGGLARAAADRLEDARRTLGLLRADSHLVREDLIRPCGGIAELMADDPLELESTEFELADKGADILGLDKKTVPRRRGEFQARKPVVRMEHLVLGGRVRQAVDLALVHARNSRRLMDDWGLGELIPYGRGAALLFSGPPGTGKTATAEALAHELEKPILVADYSRIQNCFVGQTEKNVVRIFREARSQDAVLFWDEADAMFFDRDLAARTWEVRDVNVLLQELERFDGVCILATNRKISLDKALERRIALKVDFEPPDRAQRREIWQRLLPPKLPLARDVDLDQLSAIDLTGGEIKNIILNAARLALQRAASGMVTQADFRAAVALQQSGRWCRSGGGAIGFGGRTTA